MATAMGRGTNNNQLNAIRGSKRNGCGGGSSDGGEGDVNNDSNRDGDGDSDVTKLEYFGTYLRYLPTNPT
jgi:hypothetical protein